MRRTAPRSTLRKIIKKHKPHLRLAANTDLLVRRASGCCGGVGGRIRPLRNGSPGGRRCGGDRWCFWLRLFLVGVLWEGRSRSRAAWAGGVCVLERWELWRVMG